MARIWDVSTGLPVTLTSPLGQNAQGYVPITTSGVLTGTFPINGNTTPVDNSLVNGDTSVYRLEVTYDDLNASSQVITKNLNYVARKRKIDEIYYNAQGYYPNPVSNPPALSSLVQTTASGAKSPGMTVDLTIPTYGPGYVVFVISDDLTGGNPSTVNIFQNGSTPVDNLFEYGPYNGNPAGSSDPSVGFLQFSSKTQIGGVQSFTIEID